MRPHLLLLVLTSISACNIESGLNGKPPEAEPFDTGADTDPPVDDTDVPPTEEVCNGADDDGDGLIDEGFPDADLNGRADCLDAECPVLDVGDAGVVAIVEECEGTTGGGGTVVTDPWSVRTKWTFRAPSVDASASNSYSQPVIGNLDDDNGDGVIDENDSPEVVVVAFGSRGHIVAIDGATGAEKWVYSGSTTTGGVIIADIDSDGRPDVVSFDASARPMALEGDGTLKWTAARSPSSTSYPLVSTADLDGNGTPEIIADDLVLDGPTGTVLFSLNASTSNPYRIAAVADVDQDGDQEIFMTGNAYDSDGTLLWSTGEVGTYGFWPIILNADTDDEAEIGFVGQNWTLWEDDGTRIYSVRYGATAQPGPPCAGDFDGDGVAEVAWPAYQTLVMYELDGTPVWSVPMNDTSGLAGCSGYDVDNDGALEVLFADQDSFKIIDGRTGATNYVNNDHASGTVFEYPVVADLDADGHTEIVLVSNYGATWGLAAAFEHNGDGWPAAGSTWATHDFAITNINSDGSVPAVPEASWLKYNVYRARVAADDPSTPDLVASIREVCVADCDYGPVLVGVQVANQGGSDVDAGVILSLYAEDDVPRLVATVVLPEIPAGTMLDGITIELTPADIGLNGYTAVIDDDGTGIDAVNECDEDNNADTWADIACP
ncbi:MAG: hypothetical protein V4850_28195 [Myxococcota bacterium]